MAIRGDNGYVYFNELLYRCMKRKYGPPKMNRRNQIIELSTKFRIFNNIYAKKQIDNQMVYDKLINKGNAYNPFLMHMNFKISFKTWLKHAKNIESGDIIEPKFHDVPIEVETELEFSSEDEEPKSKDLLKRGLSFMF